MLAVIELQEGSPALLILLANSSGGSGTLDFPFTRPSILPKLQAIGCRWEFANSITFDDAGLPTGSAVLIFQGIPGCPEPEKGHHHQKCGRTCKKEKNSWNYC